MINKIKVSALKSISELNVECTRLNILAGTNSSGKSTLIQAILLMFQNLDKKQGLNGELVSMGDFRADVKNINVGTNKVQIELLDRNFDTSAVLSFTEESVSFPFPDKKNVDFISQLKKYSEKLHYLSCNRIGAKDVYLKNYGTIGGIGKNGEYALHYLQVHKKDNLEKELCKDNISITLETQVNYWLKYIVNTTITVEDVPSTDIVKGAFCVGESKSQRPRNVGSGVSYIVSIIIMCLASNKDDILIIENPEIHLHPRAQSRVCEFLYYIALADRQLFIETHSDHFFNGIRSGIARNEIKNEYVNVNYFELDNNNCTKNTKIEFGKRGRVLNYTEGLFDQFDIDLNKMLDL